MILRSIRITAGLFLLVLATWIIGKDDIGVLNNFSMDVVQGISGRKDAK